MSSLVGAFVGAALSKHLFDGPTINSAGLKVLGLVGTYGAVIQIVSIASSSWVAHEVEDRTEDSSPYSKAAFFVSHVLTGGIVSVVMKLALNHIGISISYKEAFTHYALSSIAAIPLFFSIDIKYLY